METVSEPSGLCQRIGQWRGQRERVGFVPTMGNLHAGHRALIERAKALSDRVVVSVFVNPLQFGPQEDYAGYPRTPEADRQVLENAQTDLLFLPTVQTMYPGGMELSTRIEVPELSGVLEGASRPGHFAGVATVVGKLLNLVQPDAAVFGEKDFQQLLVVRRMVADLCWPLEVIGVPTVREVDGLAMSSRNRYLTTAERKRAPLLFQVLQEVCGQLDEGVRDYEALESGAMAVLARGGLVPEYVRVRRAVDLGAPSMDFVGSLVVLGVAQLGRARLIDNVSVSIS